MNPLTNKEKVISWIKDKIYEMILPLYLWSIGEKTLEDYTANLLLHELVYSDRRFAADTLEDFIKENDDMKFNGSDEYWNVLKGIVKLLK